VEVDRDGKIAEEGDRVWKKGKLTLFSAQG